MEADFILPKKKICIVGNINRDIKVIDLQAAESLLRDGETKAGMILETIGGGAANSAAIAASLGAETVLIAKTGDDEIADALEASLNRRGVACRIHRTPELKTGSTINLAFDNGERHFISCHPNNEALAFDSLDLSDLSTAAHLLRCDIWFSESMLYGGNEKLFRYAKERGVKISIDINFDPKWQQNNLEEIRERKSAVGALLPFVDMVHGNIRELKEFTDSTDIEKCLHRLEDGGAKAVVLHMGQQGSGYYADGELVVEPPCFIEQPQQATGTGDVLSMCMILQDGAKNKTEREKLRAANKVVAEFMSGKSQIIPHL